MICVVNYYSFKCRESFLQCSKNNTGAPTMCRAINKTGKWVMNVGKNPSYLY